MEMKPIFLIGFMGAGKTTLGRALGACRQFGWRYVDLDEYIETKECMGISRIFETRGEVGFRELESQALKEVGSANDVIVGCGGGTPCMGDNMEWMNSRGITVRLQASTPVLLRRLLEAQAQRPLINGLSVEALERFIEEKQAEREPYYGKAQLDFQSDWLESETEIAHSCELFCELLRRYADGKDVLDAAMSY